MIMRPVVARLQTSIINLKWCPLGLTHTQKRKLQRLRNKEKKKQEEAEKVRDEYFNKYRPMIPQGKAWQVKISD